MSGKSAIYSVVVCLAALAVGCSESGGSPERDSGDGTNVVPGTPGGDTSMPGTPGGDTSMPGTPGGDTSMPGTPGGDTSMPGGGGTGGGMSTGDGDGDGDTGNVPDLTCATQDVLDGSCKAMAEGVYAIKTTIDVWWQDDANPPLVDPGRGNIEVWLKGELTDVCDDGSGGVGVMQGCGTTLPVFKSDANCDAFQIEFPNELWDSDAMPTFTTTGSTTGFEPGDILSIATATGLVGIDLNDPDGTWPTPAETGTIGCAAGSGEVCFPDHDGDGNPGITVKMGKIGEEIPGILCGGFQLPFVHRGAPLDAVGALIDDGVKADTLFIGLRTRLGGAGAIGSDCASGSGDSTAEALDSRVWDCTKTDGTACAPAESAFVDESAPDYNILNKDEAPPTSVTVPATQGGGPLDQTPSIGPVSELVRLGNIGESFDCAAVRAALP